MATEEQIETAKRAIAHVLRRIATDADARYLFGVGTETLRQLCDGYAALTGASAEDVRRDVLSRPQPQLGDSTWDRLRALQKEHDQCPG